MKKSNAILTSIIALCMACPTYADIGKNESNPSCDQSTIGATTGTTDLEAEWDPNTINMEWYSDGSKITPNNPAANTCTYDMNVTLPTNTLSKNGYTFLGWRVRSAAAPAQSTFDLSTLNASADVGIDYASKSFAGDSCYYYNENTGQEIDDPETACSESVFSGLSTGGWETGFSYGRVKGVARCSAKSGSHHNYEWGGDSSDWSATESELTSASGVTQYCWCQVTEFKGTNDSSYRSATSPTWVFNYNYGDGEGCADGCVADCAYSVRNNPGMRAGLYGISQ